MFAKRRVALGRRRRGVQDCGRCVKVPVLERARAAAEASVGVRQVRGGEGRRSRRKASEATFARPCRGSSQGNSLCAEARQSSLARTAPEEEVQEEERGERRSLAARRRRLTGEAQLCTNATPAKRIGTARSGWNATQPKKSSS